MKSVSLVALCVSLASGAAMTIGAAPAAAQAQTAELGKEERAALLALRTAIEAKDYTTATSALARAQAAARSGYARYLASALQMRLATETNNFGLQTTALEAMIGSGAVPAAQMPILYRNQAALAQGAGKYDLAESAYSRWAALAPTDPEPLLALAQVKNDRKKAQEAVQLVERAFGLQRSAGKPVPEAWLKRALNMAAINQMAPQTLAFNRDLIAAYPSAQNWRDAVLVYRDMARPDAAAVLDSYRLLRAAKAMAGERDYLQYAQAAAGAGLHGEAKAVLEEGVAAKMVDPAKPTFKELLATSRKQATSERTALARQETAAQTAANGGPALAAADALLGAGEYPRAAALYRTALQKGSVDANATNARLGIALALAGQRAEADAALRSVTGVRGDLASLWLIWLAQRA